MRWAVRRLLLAAAVAAVAAAVTAPFAAAQPAQAAPVLPADVNDFTFGDFVGEYTLSRDDEGRSALRIVETFTAEFPDFEQNKGVVRAIPLDYDGHSVSVEVESLTRNGEPEPIYDEERSGDYLYVSTGDDDYVLGDQTYELSYTLRDVTKDHGAYQEFYWDTVGTQSSQPFASVTAIVRLDDSVAGLYAGEALCFEGFQGSDAPCAISEDGDTVTFSSTGPLGPHENVSLVMKFEQGAFEPYRAPWHVAFADRFGAVIAGVLPALGLVWAAIVRRTRGRDAPGRGTVIAQYEPPAGMSVLMADAIATPKGAKLPAQLLDLAVRGKIRILEGKPGKKTAGKPSFRLEYLDTEGLLTEELRVLESLGDPEPGARAALTSISQKRAEKLRKVADDVKLKQVFEQGYRRKVKGSRWLLAYACFALAVATWLFVVGLESLNTALIVLFVAGLLVFFITLAINHTMHPLTAKGAEAKEHLEGLRLYIRMAEQDRIRVLQSPEGAERAPIDTDDHEQLVRLYERVLPYAVLFKQEKEWAKVLASEYQEAGVQSPQWYHGRNGFTTAAMLSTVNSFSAATSTAFAPPSSSSSSGFSSGGGFSGGGGGGGGFGGR